MSSAADLLCSPVTELAGLIRSGELAAHELVAASLERIEALEPRVHAFVDVFAESALAEAAAIGSSDERPFAGVPIAIKNNRAIAGRRLTLCAELMGDFVAPRDHNVVARLKAAGFVIVGSTTLPEWGILPTCAPRRCGPTGNPWALDRTPGGSSGGSAAAVAAGMVPIAHGNDGGGSTRIPAACCGLVGLKPQRGRISLAPDVGEQYLVQDGMLTRTVAETALLLDLLAGPEVGDASWAPPPSEPFALSAARTPGPARIALTTLMPLEGATLDPACEAAVQSAASLLESLGHEVVEADPPWQRSGGLDLFTTAFGPAISLQIAFAQLLAGRPVTADDMEQVSWALWERSAKLGAVDAELARVGLHAFAREVLRWMASYDAVLTPALAARPVRHDEIHGDDPDPWETYRRSGRFTPYTAIVNVLGAPAISVPLYEHEPREGDHGPLPLAIQLIGRPAGEGALLALAAQLEAAAPWQGRRPVLAAG